MTKYIEKRDRRMYRLSLDNNDAIEASLIEVIPQLKRQRRFATVLRNGLRLMLSLMDAEEQLGGGQQPAFNALSLLEVLFPKVCEYIATRAHNTELERVRAELAELRQRVEVNGVSSPAPKRYVPDDEPQIIVTQSHDTASSQNFLSAMAGL